MDAFEGIVAKYFEHKGFWVRRSVKIELSKEEKRSVGKPSMPRPEIDLVAFNIKKNILWLVEVKSFIDSYGVRFRGVSGQDEKDAKRYKIFTKENYQELLTRKIFMEYSQKGLIDSETKINYALVAGKVYSKDEPAIRQFFDKKGWWFISPDEVRNMIVELIDTGWENDPVVLTAKIVLRHSA